MLELSVLFIIIIVLLLFIYFMSGYDSEQIRKETKETFNDYHLTDCPMGFKLFYKTNGDMICCDGEIVANRCLGKGQCTLNAKGTEEIPECIDFIMQDYRKKALEFCPQSMPNYFEDKINKSKGCTNGSYNNTMTAPSTTDQPQCIIYSLQTDNMNNLNSCYNNRRLEQAQCFGNNCTKQIVNIQPGTPALIAIGFTDTMGMPRTAYTRQSGEDYLNVVLPEWKQRGIDLSRNLYIAEVAKAVFIDRTMDKKDTQW